MLHPSELPLPKRKTPWYQKAIAAAVVIAVAVITGKNKK